MTRPPIGPPTTLLVVGDTLYTRDDHGDWYTLAALSKQLDVWFAEFDRVVIAAHLQNGPPPKDHRRLDHQPTSFVPLKRAGGSGVLAKVRVVLTLASWVRVLVPLIRQATAVHLRAPCNVTLVAIPVTRALNPNRYAIYAGNWEPSGLEPASYRLQRWMLKHWGGVVHAYVPEDADVPANVRPNSSPSFTEAELRSLEPAFEARIERCRTDPAAGRDLRVCCVAAFSGRKNQAVIVEAAALLRTRGVRVSVRFAGDGPAQDSVRSLLSRLGLEDDVELLGQLGRAEVMELYAWADVNALVAGGEGYGKVYLEGMAVGCPPVCGPGSMQRAITGGGKRGRQCDPASSREVADVLAELRDLPPNARVEMARDCRTYASAHTIEAFGRDVQQITRQNWKLPGRS